MMKRRTFIGGAGSLAVLSAIPSFAKQAILNKQYTVQQVIDLILAEGKLSPIPNTVDTIKAGSAGNTVKGIVTTMFATTDVIEQANKLNANFIIAHEPTFYNHVDDKQLVINNPVVLQKLALLDKYGITVWRFHDYLHSFKPDFVGYGFLQKTNWLQYYKGGGFTFIKPAQTLQDTVTHLKKSLGITHVRVVGNLSQPCQRITIIPGAAGGKMQISAAVADKADVLIVGEVSEWETAEFMRDANAQGRKMALIILGHSLSEEPGMEYFATWLKPKLEGVPVTHIASGEPFKWV
ncbi:hypothetical protein FPZ43_03920 [Mucilaginibacter pallidiroseus]|uniref:GTP cyclohydrolase 1 type 2 like protein n=1 Tax=Mucilaginibacter pallidiroseus TaxID=2599295 RepID=A0A563UK28_9SPHI|nr:Nif3-like dinuclear metal center hexameric protein [Mucilaginibacter pallidiroseus]TWR31629.1 hypothetical protein FPZ43_03920 [Mucilaginibacter pallidiroseus]